MERTVLHPLKDLPEHAAIIGRLLFNYADLEVDVVGMVADAPVRPLCQTHNLGGTYVQWLGAMRRCKAIRNQYAHCIWDFQRRGVQRAR